QRRCAAVPQTIRHALCLCARRQRLDEQCVWANRSTGDVLARRSRQDRGPLRGADQQCPARRGYPPNGSGPMTSRRWLILGLGLLIVGGALVGAFFATGRSGASQPELRGGPYRGSEPPSGIRIPSVTLPSYRGGRVSLRAQHGKVVVLTFLDSKC